MSLSPRAAGDPGDEVGDIGLWLEAIEFGGFDDGADGSRPIARPLSRRITNSSCPGPHISLGAPGDIIVELRSAIIEETCQRDPALTASGNGPGLLGLRRETAQDNVERLMQLGDQRLGAVLLLRLGIAIPICRYGIRQPRTMPKNAVIAAPSPTEPVEKSTGI